MFCKYCGKEIKGSEKFCPNCGKNVKSEENEMTNNQNASGSSYDYANNITTKGQKTKSKKKRIFIIVIAVVVVLGVFVAVRLMKANKEAQNTINTLCQFTDEIKSDDSYSFNYKHMWEIKYVEENEFVSFYDADAGYYVASALGGSDIENDGTFTYDFSDNDFRIYLDYETPSGELTIINYSVDDDEFTLMIDGERRNPTKEFDQKLRETGLIEDIFNDDLDKFEQNLQENGLSLGDVSSVSYNDVKSKSQ
ncbi:zinc ribbon domain-containing protein [Dorea amylophila]|uniref:Predicted membrane protein n=1 Tax=Dorea longicatena TaxID=88431 RepID=A0A174SIJ4_9FIRM|nr:zinc ribbon domain-containing protein [Dorea longicatena]MCU6742062.1 zinc ribbon domain-containing protein [Dorea amylophila]CUP95737.1 Predicted membrane protein [Dorea longicatena]